MDYILVIGDLMIDKHIFGKSSRLSPEAPVPIVEYVEERESLGGAANVASHISSAGLPCLFAFKTVDFSSSILSEQEDEYDDIFSLLKSKNIKPIPLCLNQDCPITKKQRIWANGQQICRIDEESTESPDEVAENKWITLVFEKIEEYNVKVIIFSDYNKGTLTDSLINIISEFAKSVGIKTILDPKRPSFPYLKNLNVIKPNRKEVGMTNYSAHKCSTLLGDTYLVNTLGKDGTALWQNGHYIYELPTVAEEVADVTGCGDSYNALLGISLYWDYDIKQAIIAANKASSYTIKHLGCYCLTKEEIAECLREAGDGET